MLSNATYFVHALCIGISWKKITFPFFFFFYFLNWKLLRLKKVEKARRVLCRKQRTIPRFLLYRAVKRTVAKNTSNTRKNISSYFFIKILPYRYRYANKLCKRNALRNMNFCGYQYFRKDNFFSSLSIRIHFAQECCADNLSGSDLRQNNLWRSPPPPLLTIWQNLSTDTLFGVRSIPEEKKKKIKNYPYL